MKLKVPKTERKRPQDSRLRRILRRALIIALVVGLMGLAASHLLALITGYDVLAVPEEGVSAVMTPLQTGFSTVVDWVVDYLYTLKLRARIELEYNQLKTENEQLVYDAMLAEEMQHKLSVYENLYDEISVNESLNPLVATVIGRESGNYFSVFTINKGSNDGVEDYMAVTMDGAMVGYTYNVTPTKSTVRTIIDSEAAPSAWTARPCAACTICPRTTCPAPATWSSPAAWATSTTAAPSPRASPSAPCARARAGWKATSSSSSSSRRRTFSTSNT